MLRLGMMVLLTALTGWPALGQTAPGAPRPETRPAQTPPAIAQPTPEQVPPNAAAITIRGFCPGGNQGKADACVTTITKEEFDRMIAAMSVNPQALSSPVALRSFAESYVQALALSEAGEKDGIDKDPQFLELMRIIRVRTLADAYRRRLQQKYSNPSSDEVEAYYKQNIGRFEQMELDRIALPKTNPKLPREAQADFARKAEKLATEIHDRAAKGEDPSKLQEEAYKSLGLTPPLTTDLGVKRRGSLPAALEQELFSLKPGEVSKPQTDAAMITIYKVRSRSTLPLERVKPELIQEIQQKNLQAAIQQAAGRLQTDFNPKLFAPGPAPHGLPQSRKP